MFAYFLDNQGGYRFIIYYKCYIKCIALLRFKYDHRLVYLVDVEPAYLSATRLNKKYQKKVI